MGQEDETASYFKSMPCPVVINLQGGRRGLMKIEPAFEAIELLRRHNPHKTLYSCTPDYLDFIDGNLPGSKVKFYQVQLKSNSIIIVTVNSYRGNDFRLAHDIIDILGGSAQRTTIVSTYPDPYTQVSQRQVQRFSYGEMAISPAADLFAFSGILSELGLVNVEEFIVTRPAGYDFLGMDGLAIFTLLEELLESLGCHNDINNPHNPLVKAMLQVRQRYYTAAHSAGAW